MSFPTRLNELLEAGTVSVRSFAKFELGGGPKGLWNGRFEIVVSGVTYYPNSVIKISEPVYGLGTTAASFKIELASKRDFQLTPDILSAIEDEDYKGRLVTIYDGWFDPETQELLHMQPMIYGFIDTLDHIRSADEKKLVGNCVSSALDNHRNGYRQASHEDQQLVSPGDLFFEHASKTRTQYDEIEL